MNDQIDIDAQKRKLPILGQVSTGLDVDAELARFEAEERERLGIKSTEQWIEDMADLSFTKRERENITLLIGGLTQAQDFLIEGGLKSLGYDVLALDVPDNAALQVGKEFGNRAQCNPTYFTVGNLVKFLIHLRDKKGLSTQEIIDRYVFLTAGACGPCRFGMYVTEYRKALRDAGFDGFRVMLFSQKGGLNQATGEEKGLELNPKFFITLLSAMVSGDVLNALAYRIRPFEVVPGATDKAFGEAKQVVYDHLRGGKNILVGLWKAGKIMKGVEVNRLQPKPKTAIIGEFWAMTTEGDGNYALQRFLEGEGSEVDIQLVTAWILFNIWEVRFDTGNRATLKGHDQAKKGLAGIGDYGVAKRLATLWVAEKVLRGVFQTFAHCVGLYDYHLPDMGEVARVAAPYYNNDLRGGEGHMEVGKLILNVAKNKATMTLSVKPFGCMPSSGVSDGVQSLIAQQFPGTIYCAVETSGDGAVNFYSRVQMYLFKAKQAAQKELAEAYERTGLTEERVREFLAKNPRFASALHRAPHVVSSTAADLVYEIADHVDSNVATRTFRAAKRLLGLGRETLTAAVTHAPAAARTAASVLPAAGAELFEITKEHGPAFAKARVEKARQKVASVLPFAGAAAAG